MATTFVDTSGLYALIDADDESHNDAVRIWSRLLDQDDDLVTHNYVVVEAVTLLQVRIGFRAVTTLRTDHLPLIRTWWVSESVHETALSALTAGSRRVSFVDRVSFEMMRTVGARSAFAFDEHFRTAGFALARP